MSVLIPIVDTWDGLNRRIHLKQGVSDFFPMEDLYAEYRNERRTNEAFRKWSPLLRAEGNVPKGAGAFTPRYIVLIDGTKIVPYDEVLQVNQLGDIITDDPDTDATLYDISTLTVPKVIYIKPSEAETIQLNSDAIEYSSYDGMVSVDVVNGEAGTVYPVGNQEHPVNNFTDAQTIANTKGFRELGIRTSCTLDAGTDFTGFRIHGISHVSTIVTVDASALLDQAVFTDIELAGALDSYADVTSCLVRDLTYFNGHIHNSSLGGTVTLAGDKESFLSNCTRLENETMPTIDFNNGNNHLVLANYAGAIKFTKMTISTVNALVGLNMGRVILDTATCTAGILSITGIGDLVDELGNNIETGTWNGITIVNNLISNGSVASAVWTDTSDPTLPNDKAAQLARIDNNTETV